MAILPLRYTREWGLVGWPLPPAGAGGLGLLETLVPADTAGDLLRNHHGLTFLVVRNEGAGPAVLTLDTRAGPVSRPVPAGATRIFGLFPPREFNSRMRTHDGTITDLRTGSNPLHPLRPRWDSGRGDFVAVSYDTVEGVSVAAFEWSAQPPAGRVIPWKPPWWEGI